MSDLPNPVSRTEDYLAAIAGEAVELPEYPVSRIEEYLAKIAGESVDVPEYPVSRIEEYLAYIAENGGVVEPIPLTITENGTYTAPTGQAYTPVVANVSIGGETEVWTFTLTDDSVVEKEVTVVD